MPRNLLWRLPLAASVFVTLGGLLVSCGPPDGGVKFDIPLLLSGPNLIKDGNFESSEQMPFKDSPGEPINPVQGATGSQAKALCGGSNSLLPNWSVSRVSAPRQDCSLPGTGGAADSVFWVNTPSNATGVFINAQDGSKFIELMGFPRPAFGRIEQTVQTSPGSDYVLFFWIGSTTAFPVQSPTSIVVEAVNAETNHPDLSQIVHANFPASGVSDWEAANTPPGTLPSVGARGFLFTATGSRTIISFTGSGSDSNALWVGLDNVELYCAGSRRPGFYFVGC